MDIAALIRATKGDRSYEQLSKDCGGVISAARLQQIATKAPKEFPEPATIAGLARGLRVADRQVLLAWAESLGLGGQDAPRLAELLPPSAADLEDDETAAVLAVVHAMTKKEREGSGQQPAPTNPAGTAPATLEAVLNTLERPREQLRRAIEGALRQRWSSNKLRMVEVEGVLDQYIVEADRVLTSLFAQERADDASDAG